MINKNLTANKRNSLIYSFNFILLSAVLIASAFFSSAAYCAPSPADSEEVSSEARDAFLSNAEFEKAKSVIDNFLKALLAGDKSYERYTTPEVGEECIGNFYMVDKYIIKNYKRTLSVNNYGEAACVYDGGDETVRQEFNLIKNSDGELKINSISEKRYIKMNENRRKCYLNTRAVYKTASLLQVLYENMQLPSMVDFELLKSKKLLNEPVSCPSNGTISIAIDKNNDSQNNEVIARCSIHGDFFELYKLDDKLSMDYDKYNLKIDKDEEAILNRIGGELYKAFVKLQPVEDAFYAQYEKQNTSEMFRLLNQALTVDKRLGNMYITLIRAFRAAGNEKSAREIYDMAIKVYPEWEELKNVLNEKQAALDGGDDIED